MKKVVIMSDSHLCNARIDYVLEKENDADMYLHCGDLCDSTDMYPQLIVVRGNNDYYDYPMQIIKEIEGRRLIMFHSHQFFFSQLKHKMVLTAIENDCDIICYGHTHIADIDEVEGIQIINPGSLQMSRDGRDISYAVMYVDGKDVKVELKFIEETKNSWLPWR